MEKINIIKKDFEKEKKVTAIGYDRISSPKFLEKKLSPEVQKQRIIDYCKFKSWELLYVEVEVKSGKDIEGRTRFQKVLEDIRNGKANCLVVNDFSRSFRNMEEAIRIMNELRDIGSIIVSIANNVDTSTPDGRAMYGMLSVFNEMQRSFTKQRVEEIIQYKVERGLNIGKVPNGYKYAGKGKPVKINPEESQKIKEMFNMTINRISYKEICEKFNIKPFHYYRVIRNPFYTGKIIYNENIYIGLHEAIIDNETFEKANSILKRRKFNTPLLENVRQ